MIAESVLRHVLLARLQFLWLHLTCASSIKQYQCFNNVRIVPLSTLGFHKLFNKGLFFNKHRTYLSTLSSCLMIYFFITKKYFWIKYINSFFSLVIRYLPVGHNLAVRSFLSRIGSLIIMYPFDLSDLCRYGKTRFMSS